MLSLEHDQFSPPSFVLHVVRDDIDGEEIGQCRKFFNVADFGVISMNKYLEVPHLVDGKGGVWRVVAVISFTFKSAT